MFETDEVAWATRVFQDCQLGDERRVGRLIQMAALHAGSPEASTAAMCAGDTAAKEGAYRFLRNPHFETADVDEGAFCATAENVKDFPLVLAIQDTTTVSFTRASWHALAESGSPTGFLAHTTLVVDPVRRMPVGVVDQDRWIREPKSKRPGRATRRQRAYEDKESHRWEEATKRTLERLGTTDNVIHVADREADIFEYLSYLKTGRQRFVLRACSDRALMTADGRHLWESLEAQAVVATRTVLVEQRGGQAESISQPKRGARRAREAVVELRAAVVKLKPPLGKAAEYPAFEVHAVLVRESDAPAGTEPIEWMLLTSEAITTKTELDRIVSYYECRWMIEEYFKVWKSGCRIEDRPLMSVETVDRMLAVTAHVAIRLMQLHAQGNRADDTTPCDEILERDEWHCLWVCTSAGKPVPKSPPSARWAFQTIARLGGWLNTKATGRIGWKALWNGWDKLEARLIGWRAANAASGK